MGLDVSHDCWHGAYSAFMRWRTEIARVAGIPLVLMQGFYEEPPALLLRDETFGWALRKYSVGMPIQWDVLKPDPLHILLNHSDCDGEIAAADCGPIADRLEQLIPLLPETKDGGHIGDWRATTLRFVVGLREAAAAGENVEFH